MPAEQPVQHLYQVYTPKGTVVGVMARTIDEAVRLRRQALVAALIRRATTLDLTAEHYPDTCPGCGAKPAAVSDLYPEAEP
jgi:hypothetical protein